MKIRCKKSNLQRGLSVVSRIVPTRTTLPVLGNVLLRAQDGRLDMTSTDLEAAMNVEVSAKIEQDGSITVPLKTFMDFVLTVSDEEMAIDTSGADVLVKSSHYSVNIKGIDASEFPIIPKIENPKIFKMKSLALKKSLPKIIFAAALDETRPVLAGVYMKMSGNKLVLAATDSYRLAEQKLETQANIPESTVIVPSRTLAELERILPESDEAVEIKMGENQIEFATGSILFMTRLIEGAFPDYEQIMPKKFESEIEINKNEFGEALKVAGIFARESSNNIKIAVAADAITLKAASANLGQTEARVKAQVKGAGLEVAFNGKYILDAIANISGETVALGLSGKLSPGMLTSGSEKDYRYVIMPLRNE